MDHHTRVASLPVSKSIGPHDCPLVEIAPRRWVCPVCDPEGEYPLPRMASRPCGHNDDTSGELIQPPEVQPERRPTVEEIEAFLDQLWDRKELGLSTVPWEETLRRVEACKACRYMAPPEADVEMRCRACGGCAGDKGFKYLLALTTDERDCPKSYFNVPPGAIGRYT